MAINFPTAPTLNQTYTFNGRTWTYNNVGWQATGSTGLTVYTKTNFTATAGQTSFSCTYTVGFVDVYYNGSKLSSSEYTATTGSTVVLGTACSVNDIVETIAWTISSSFNPSLGSASATSLAIGGATIGSNALAVTGTSTFSGTITAPQLQGPAFYAYASANQNISSNTATKVTLDTEVFDTANNFASNRFTPTLAGYYLVTANVTFDDTVAASGALCYVYKNGSVYQTFFIAGAAGPTSLVGTAIVSMNGSTDYIELYGQVTGTAPYFRYINASRTSSMSAAFLRSL